MKNTIFLLFFFSNLSILAQKNLFVTLTNINLRESNSVNSSSITIIEKGDTIEMLLEDPQWSKVQFSSFVGYASTKYLLKIENDNITQNEEQSFSGQKGFVAGFKFTFGKSFFAFFIIVGSIIMYLSKKKDARYKNGYREQQMSTSTAIKLAIYSAIISLIIGIIGGIISIFH